MAVESTTQNSNSTKQQQALKVLESLEHMTNCGMAISRDDVYCLLEACSDGADLHIARRMQALMSKNFLFPVTALSDQLIRLFTACGSSDKAIDIFHKVPNPTAYTCNAAMAAYTKLGYAHHGRGHAALDLLMRMKKESIKPGDGLSVMELIRAMLKEGLMPDKVTLICGVKACGMLGVLEWGNWVYAALVEVNLESDLVLGTVLVDMYCKCDSMEDGCRVFYEMPERDTELWGALIAGHAAKGNFAQVHASLLDMQKQGLMPSDVIFTSILSACSQAGLLEEGFICFRIMIEGFGVFPTDEHCGCMVDLFARVGRLDDASDLSSTLDFYDAVVMRSLLSSCKTYEQSNLATRSFEYFYDK